MPALSPALKNAVYFFISLGVSRRQLTAALLISLLAAPTAFGIPAVRHSPLSPNAFQIPVSAPPEPFIIHRQSSLISLVASALSYASSTVTSLAFSSRPDGLGEAHLSTVSERMVASITPILGLINPSSNNVSTRLEPPTPPQPSSVVDFDFDNDGKTDIGRWHSANTEFKVRNSNGGAYSTFTLGTSSSVLAPGDFNGDGKTDAAVFSGGTWTYKTSPSATAQTISWGTTGDIPVAGDYDGDGTTDAAIYRPSTNTWWILKSTGGNTSTALGSTGDIAVPGDYDGDGKNDVAVYRPSTGFWYVNPSNGVPYTFQWGIAIDTPVPADYDGDGKTDPAVFRPSTGTWYIHRSSDGVTAQQAWGNYRDQPVPGDYDGDSKADYAIWRPTTGTWYTLKSSDSNFEINTLGVPTDTAIPSAYLKQVGGQVSGDALAAARLASKNEIGGTNLYSQNFSWGRSLVSLPGRAGLDAGFGISYNSLVWTKVGSAMVFDPDYSNASPGFRFGFPTIEPVYYDTDGGKNVWAYMMITPSGSRVQFRQTTASNVYETADSSYTQLVTTGASNPNDPVEDVTIKVTTTDGTQMSYVWSMGAYRCTQIKDRNGNFITLATDSEGRLSTMTDTLGRVVTVNYETATGYPSTITQTWKDGNGSGSNLTHTWASFTYVTKPVDTDFGTGITTIVGPPDGTNVSLLDKITYPDGSSTRFDYNGYLQVTKVSNVAGDSPTHILNYVETNLTTPTSPASDCPRFTQTSTFAQNFNGGTPVVVTNEAPVSSSFAGPYGSESTMVVKAKVVGHPDNLYTRLHYGPSGYKDGLVLATEDCTGTDSACATRNRWTWADWTQDNASASYVTNPRVKETRVGDTTNVKVTKTDYRIVGGTTNTAEYGLASEVRVYDDNDLTNPIKKVATDYNLASAYTSRRIIGLPSQVEVWGKNDVTSSLEYVSKVTFAYDDEDFSIEGNQIINATKHDATNYGSTFVIGRGNLTTTTRHDVTSATAASVSRIRYDIAGSPVAQLDPRNRKTTISYTDNFNSTVSQATYAFPTTITDPGQFSSTIQYRYDIGANIHAESPTPYGASDGKNTSRTYDDTIGRLVKEKIDNTGAYTRYDYPNNDGVTVKTFTTVVDITGVGTIDSSDEVLTETLLDGAGRVRMTRTENPNSTGGYTGKLVEYDLLGRVKRETVPTEIDSAWTPAGEDDRGTSVWLWNSREYDWKDRVTREINTDGTDKLYSYEGCGCAGGQETTIKGEITEAIDAAGNPQTTKRRTQKIVEDILGRVKETQIWDLDGGDGITPYSTTVNKYNGRDQLIVAEQHEGLGSSSVHQDTTFEFDGHGRLKKSHKPENRDSSNVATHTAFTYYSDDSVATMTDPRGAVTTYKYSSLDDGIGTDYRPLLTEIEYTSPNPTNIPEPDDVTFTYDPLGNRISMSDGSGSLNYSYDDLSRQTSETKTFASGILSTPRTGGYTLQYTYQLTGGIKSITDPNSGQGWHVEYTSDKIGRLTAIGNATGFGTQASFASSIAYRAFGGVKSMTYSTSTNVALTYDNRLRPETYEAESSANTVDIQNKAYTYTNDDSIKQSTNAVDSDYSQTYAYDFAARLKKNDVGGLGTSTPGTRYKQTLGYDKFDNLTSRSTTDDGTTRSFTAGYTDNRKTSGGYQNGIDYHDAAGNITRNSRNFPDATDWKFDAAGRVSDWQETSTYLGTTRWDQGEAITFDGDGRTAKRVKRSRLYAFPETGWSYEPEYYITSSVTGQKLIELDNTGARKKVNIYMGSTVIAEHTVGGTAFKYTDPVTGSTMQTDSAGEIEAGDVGRVEMEPMGAVLPTTEPELNEPPHDFGKGGSTSDPEGGCAWNGASIKCDMISAIRNVYSARPATRQSTGASESGSTPKPKVPPTLKKRTKEEIANAKALSHEALHKNPSVFDEVDPPDFDNGDAQQIIGSILTLANLFANRIKIIGFNSEQKRDVERRMLWMLISKKCVDAFKAAGLPTPAQVARDRGVVIAHWNALELSSNNSVFGISEEERIAIRISKNDLRKGGFTFETTVHPGPAISLFYEWSFKGQPSSFDENFTHESIHRSGVGIEQGWLSYFRGEHDLYDYGPYGSIVESCRMPENVK